MPAYGKNIKVSGDTKIHMTSTYTRNGLSKKKKSIFRQFSFVIKGLLISTTLVGAVLTTGGAQAFADTTSITPTVSVTQKAEMSVNYRDQAAMISNLKMANRVLQTAINRGEITTTIYDNVMLKLQAINSKLELEGNFTETSSLVSVVKETDKVLKSEISTKSSNSILAKRADSLAVLGKTQDLLGIKERGADEMTSKHGMIIETTKFAATKERATTVYTSSISSKPKMENVSVTINGVKQVYAQSAVVTSGSTLVPMRAIFEKLGATIMWSQTSSTVTATKGDTVIKLTIGNQTAYVNGSPVKLSSKPQLVNGNTMVPLRFVSEALGGSVTWDQANKTVKIINTDAVTGGSGGSVEQPTYGSGNSANGISTRYGKHDYASRNQSEYDKVMKIIDAAVDEIPSMQLGDGGRFQNAYEQFLEGDKASNYDPSSMEYRNLSVVEARLSALVDAGLSKYKIADLQKATMVAGNLLAGIEDPGTGTPRSAYDALISRLTDCDSDAQVYSAIFDSLGYPTAIIASTGHADVIIKIEGKWYNTSSATFTKVDVSAFLAQPGKYVMSSPTDGSALK
jgi:hypothetical protein